jgi:hypothetical protein
MNRSLMILLTLAGLTLSIPMFGQTKPGRDDSRHTADDYSGMYTFLQEGEFVQLTVEDNGSVTGFVSRYKDGEGNDHPFLDHFFKQGKLDGKKLSFVTENVDNVSYEFKGTIERGEGKKPEDEAYYVLKGVLTQYQIEADKKTSTKSQSVVFKSFPQDADAPK